MRSTNTDDTSATQRQIDGSRELLTALEFSVVDQDDNERLWNEAVQARMRDLRKSRNWSQRHMADLLGISKANYEKYEKGRSVPAFILPRFADIFDVSLDWLLGRQTARTHARRRA